MVPVCVPTLKNHPLGTNLYLHCINNHQLEQSIILFCHTHPINVLLPSITFYAHVIFLCLFVSFVFIAHFLSACGSLRELRKFFSFVYLLVCQIIHSFLVSALTPCMLYLSYYFQPKVNT